MKTYVHEQHESKVSCQTSSAMCSKAHLLCGPGESFHYKRVGSLEDLTLCDNWRLGEISDATLCIFFSFHERSLTVASFTSNQLLCFWKGAAPTCGLPATRLRSKTKPPSGETERPGSKYAKWACETRMTALALRDRKHKQQRTWIQAFVHTHNHKINRKKKIPGANSMIELFPLISERLAFIISRIGKQGEKK